MARLLWLLFLLSLAFRLVLGFWPWQMASDPRAGGDIDRARTLLGVGASATREDILDAHRRLLIRVHPDRGGSAQQVHEADAARDLLLSRLDRR